MIDISCEFEDYESLIEDEHIKEWSEKVFNELNLNDNDLSVYFCSDETIKNLNNEYREKDYVTDVLSFSQVEEGNKNPMGLLGDVVICINKASEQAKELGHSLSSEIDFLILHSILHLIGYDHETDNGEMDLIQKEIFYKLTGESIE